MTKKTRDDSSRNFSLISFSITDVPGPPDAPVVSEIFAEHCMLAWTPPADDGGAPITGFHVERRMIGGDRWARVNKEQVSGENIKFWHYFMVYGRIYHKIQHSEVIHSSVRDKVKSIIQSQHIYPLKVVGGNFLSSIIVFSFPS